ncbi:MAG: hypothetical protein JO306_03820, partial [Gemmatimonadetes bacterium]|nr:hypothetical protein [Gemmatimonadota bacterium]
MEIACPRCGAPLPAGDVDAVTGLVRCRACDEVFRHVPAAGHAPPPPREVIPGPAPAGITVLEDGRARTLFYRWRSRRTVMITLFSVLWIASIRYGLTRPGVHVGTGVRIFVDLALALGIYLAYWARAE